MARRFLLLLALLFFCDSARAAPEAPPDVIVLVADGLSAKLTPAMQALAAHGRVFERAYVPNPKADPVRVALFYGRRPERSSIWDEPKRGIRGAQSLAGVFNHAGYVTARIGRAVGALDEKARWGQTSPPAAGSDTSRAIVKVLQGTRSQPLFLWASFDDLGPLVSVAEGGKGPAAGREIPAIAFSDLDRLARPGRWQALPSVPEEARQSARRAQDERMRRFDAQLARVVAALDERSRWSSTIVVLLGASAPFLGEHGQTGRSDMLFEESLRVPLVIAAPGLAKPGAKTEALADVTDVLPTLAELAGTAIPEGVEGVSLAAAVRDPDASARKGVASVVRREGGRLGRSVRTPQFRFTEWPDGSLELYDEEKDPHEYMNLARTAEGASNLAAMKARLDRRDPPARATAAPPRPRAAARRPNVLLVVMDDANMHLGTYGYPVQTPNIDRLAARGRRFDRAYAQVAMCSPSRTSFLSGWQPIRTGVFDNNESPRRPGMVPLQEHLAAAGYFTAEIGKVWETRFARDFKWDLSEYDPPLPVSAAASATPAPEPEETKEPRSHRRDDLSGFWRITNGRDEDEPDGRRARRVADLMGAQRDRPFFIALGFAKPHLRWVAPRRYFDLYKDAEIPLPPNPPDDSDDIPEIAIKDEVSRPGRFFVGRADDVDAALRRQATAAYYATVSFVDAQLGVVLDALDRDHLWDDTIVVLLSDNGFHLGEHRGDFWRKDTLFEEGVRVPLVIAAPGLAKPGTATSSLAELLDLYPTLVELTGAPAVPGQEGKSLVPVLHDPAATVHEAAYSWRRVNPPSVAVSLRSGEWRYTEWPDGTLELYDLDKDPGAKVNLAGRAEQAEVVAELRRLRLELVP